MMEAKEQEEISIKLKDLRSEISNLKTKLNELNEKKELWFDKKSELQKQISDLISSVKQIKSEKDSFNKELFEEKEIRDKHNSEVKLLVAEIKKLNKDRKDFLAKHKLKFDPSKLKEKIRNLEESIETEAYSFEKEKRVMAEIKKLKKFYDETSQLNVIVDKSDEVSKDIEEAKAKADKAHKKFKDLSHGNKDGYKDFIDTSKKINEIKKEEEAAYRSFIEFKKEFNAVNTQLKQKLVEVKELQSKISGIREEKQRERKSKEQQILKEKARGVEEKLKKRKKLTTEDLIVFQGHKEED